jgi:hypothetical protein
MVPIKEVAAHTRLSPHRRLIEICALGRSAGTPVGAAPS